RTFIAPIQSMRDQGVQMKYAPPNEAIAGKRIVLIDDSIVRGSTTRQIPEMLRQAGAAEIHMRISSPPIKHPCFYGIDFGEPAELIANKLEVEQIRTRLGVDSLHYLSTDGMVEATGFPKSEFCLACFDNNYPIALPENGALGKHVLENGQVPAATPKVG